MKKNIQILICVSREKFLKINYFLQYWYFRGAQQREINVNKLTL